MVCIDDIYALFLMKMSHSQVYKREKSTPDVEQCWWLLKQTSRSFAAVIEELNPELREAMMIFYLVLRGLDTVEDDVGLDLKIKVPLLRKFKTTVLTTKDWTFHESSPTEKDRIVLQQFDLVLKMYHDLRPEYQDIIADITDKMGNGMADYVEKEAKDGKFMGLDTVKDYDLYCHYVAGLVGEGITHMAVVANFGLESEISKPELYESMGLFLQKTNIIRDYREDLDEGRSFWPKDIWSKYGKQLSDFKTDKEAGMYCVSNLLLLSLNHVTDCLKYLENIHEPSLFKFCAIPQVMSIATLELVFNNPEVFDKNVKIPKSLAVKLILGSNDMHQVYEIFRKFVVKIHQRNVATDPNYFDIEQTCSKIIQYIYTNDDKGHAAVARDKKENPGNYMDEEFNFYMGVTIGGSVIVAIALVMVFTAKGLAHFM